jgi:hypothetical protein
MDHTRAQGCMEQQGYWDLIEVVADVAGGSAANEEVREARCDWGHARKRFDGAKRIAKRARHLSHFGATEPLDVGRLFAYDSDFDGGRFRWGAFELQGGVGGGHRCGRLRLVSCLYGRSEEYLQLNASRHPHPVAHGWSEDPRTAGGDGDRSEGLFTRTSLGFCNLAGGVDQQLQQHPMFTRC